MVHMCAGLPGHCVVEGIHAQMLASDTAIVEVQNTKHFKYSVTVGVNTLLLPIRRLYTFL